MRSLSSLLSSWAFFTCLIHFFLPLSLHAENRNFENLEAPPIQVIAPMDDEFSSRVEVEAQDIQLNETLQRVPGANVQTYSGPGGLTTATAPAALNSGETAIHLDGIPLQDPIGTGIDLSLFPSSLIGDVNYAASDGFDLHLLEPGQASSPHWHTSLLFGSGYTGAASLAYQGGSVTDAWAAGIGTMGTQGHFQFAHPLTGKNQTLQDNDSARVTGLMKYRRTLQGTGELEVFSILSGQRRSNPSSISSQPGLSSSSREKDKFGLLALRYTDSAWSAALAGTYSQSAIETLSNVQDDGALVIRSGYAQTAYQKQSRAGELRLSAENRYVDLKTDSGFDKHNILRLAASHSLFLRRLALTPSSQVEHSSLFGDIADAGIKALIQPRTDLDLTVSYEYQHHYPDLPSVFGYSVAGFQLLPNSSLTVGRDHLLTLGQSYHPSGISLSSSIYYHRASDRPVLTFLSDNIGRMENLAIAQLFGLLINVQVPLTTRLNTEISGQLSKTNDLATGKEIPNKPSHQALLALRYQALPWLECKVEEQLTGKRFADLANSRVLSSYTQTHLHVGARVRDGQAFFRASNLWNAPGFVTEGFPLAGRSFWVGYQK